jgi:hypothetical protein
MQFQYIKNLRILINIIPFIIRKQIRVAPSIYKINFGYNVILGFLICDFIMTESKYFLALKKQNEMIQCNFDYEHTTEKIKKDNRLCCESRTCFGTKKEEIYFVNIFLVML